MEATPWSCHRAPQSMNLLPSSASLLRPESPVSQQSCERGFVGGTGPLPPETQERGTSLLPLSPEALAWPALLLLLSHSVVSDSL